jgi:vancomycin resistance protein VanJ
VRTGSPSMQLTQAQGIPLVLILNSLFFIIFDRSQSYPDPATPNFGGWLYLPLALLLPCLFYRQIRKQLLALLAIPLLIFGWEYSWCLVPKWDNRSVSLTAMTWNLRYDNPDPQAIATVIKSQHPDIIAVQELVETTASKLSQELNRDFPFQVISPAFEFGIFSKYPIESIQPAELDPKLCKFQEVSVLVGKREVELIDVHLPTPAFKARQLGFLPIPIDFNTNKQDRAYQVLLDRIAQIDRPLLVMGDFNTSDRDRNYQLMNKSLTNASHVAGWGFGFTYPIEPPLETPLIRIDHIFYSRQWQALTARTVKGIGSDHQYLVANLKLD